MSINSIIMDDPEEIKSREQLLEDLRFAVTEASVSPEHRDYILAYDHVSRLSDQDLRAEILRYTGLAVANVHVDAKIAAVPSKIAGIADRAQADYLVNTDAAIAGILTKAKQRVAGESKGDQL